MKSKIYLMTVLTVILSSCANRWIAPPFTEVSKIAEVKSGMSIREVNITLGIDPYDIYHIQEDGSSVLVYNYRRKDRRMPISSNPNQAERSIHTAEGQTSGEAWYGSTARLYCLFTNGKLKSLITDAGREDSEYILIIQNDIQLVAKEHINTYMSSAAQSNPTTGQAQILIPLDKGQFALSGTQQATGGRVTKKSENPNQPASQQIDDSGRKRKKLAVSLGIAAGIGIISAVVIGAIGG